MVSAIVKTAGAKEFGYFEQAHQRWLLLHVPAFVSYWDRGSGCCHILTDQIFVITTMANTAFSLYYAVLGVNWLLLFLSWLLTLLSIWLPCFPLVIFCLRNAIGEVLRCFCKSRL